jgi:hypothetical protein
MISFYRSKIMAAKHYEVVIKLIANDHPCHSPQLAGLFRRLDRIDLQQPVALLWDVPLP